MYRFGPMALILIGGTPGTGKTEVTKVLAQRLECDVAHLGDIAKENGCISEHDDDRDTGVINEDCLVEAILDLLDEHDDALIIEGHYIDLVPGGGVSKIFLLRAHPDILIERLKARGYEQAKVTENMEAEIFGVCQLDAIDAFGEQRVFEIDTSDLSVTETVERIMQLLGSREQPIRIDWMEELESEGRLEDYVKDD
jgi:adenylate kinase